MKKGTLACAKDDVRLPFYLPMEILSLEREMNFVACGTKTLRKTDIFQVERKIYFCLGKKVVLLPVERGVLNCLWK